MNCPDCNGQLARRHVEGMLLFACNQHGRWGRRSPFPRLWIFSSQGLVRARAQERILLQLAARQDLIDAATGETHADAERSRA
jgi:hypothetical protein